MGRPVYHVTDERVFLLSMSWMLVYHKGGEQVNLLLVLVVLICHGYGG
jgi:hypothetical protein